jgi:uncharacterized protein (DUF1499 family)
MTETIQTSQSGWLVRNYSRIALAGFAVAVLGAAIEFGSGLGYRFGLVPLGVALQRMLPWGAYVAAAGAVLCVIALILGLVLYKGAFLRRSALAIVGLLVGLVSVYIPYSIRYASDTPLPPIHDISTDLDNPPEFVDVVPLRQQTGATNPPEYRRENKRGDAIIKVPELQRSAYPDIQSIVFEGVSQPEAFNRALEAVKRQGWTLVAAKAEEGRIEATDRTFWFGFYDDVVIRVTAVDNGSRIDVRSKSRVGGGDVGKNAQRIRGYTRTLRSIEG